MTMDTNEKKKRRSTKHEKFDGVLLAMQLMMANFFNHTKAHPLRFKNVRDFLMQQIGIKNAEEEKLFVRRWSDFLNRLPDSGGRLSPNEISLAREYISENGLSKGMLPRAIVSELLPQLNLIIGDIPFYGLCNQLRTEAHHLDEMEKIFCNSQWGYRIYRYSMSANPLIAEGRLLITRNENTGAIVTTENYRTADHDHQFSGYLLRQRDGGYRIFSVHERDNEPQTIQIQGVETFAQAAAPVPPAGLERSSIQKMYGTILDRHEGLGLYAVKTIIIRETDKNVGLAPRTIDQDQMKEIIGHDNFDLLSVNTRQALKENIILFY